MSNRSVPDFSLIEFLPPGKRVQLSNPQEETSLFKIFNSVINHQRLEIDQHQLEQIFCRNLLIDTKTHDKRLVAVLREALVYFMTVWPGWKRSNEYYSGQLECRDWYKRFRQYLIFKCNYIIRNAAEFAKDTKSSVKETAVQTVANKDFCGTNKTAPYTLCVHGPPAVLNNIVFMESEGNIVISRRMEKSWSTLQMKEFLNWPHVAVEVKLPDIWFSRANAHVFERYITVCRDVTVVPDVNNIAHIKKTADAIKHEAKPYTYDFISCYLQQLCETLKSIPGIKRERLQELQAIFTEFLADIKEVNVCNCTMNTYTSIGYHIGKCNYIRNKMSSSNTEKKLADQNGINFYEILIPQIDFTLNYFKATQDFLDKTKVSFQSLKKLLNKVNSAQKSVEDIKFIVNNACIVYHCTLCLENFSGPHANFNVTQHFSVHHKAEQALLCLNCRKRFEVQFLAGQRWKHVCSQHN